MFSGTFKFSRKHKDCRAPYVFSEPYYIGLAQWFLIWGALTLHPSWTFGHIWRLLLVTSWRTAVPLASSGWGQGCFWTPLVPRTAPRQSVMWPPCHLCCDWDVLVSGLWWGTLVSSLNRTQMSLQQVASLHRASRFPGCGFEREHPAVGVGWALLTG